MKIAIVSADSGEAKTAEKRLKQRYGCAAPQDASVIVALGGDGFMLETAHAHLGSGKAIYGMNRGTVGFLMNAYDEDNLEERLSAAEQVKLNPLRMLSRTVDGQEQNALAINEVSLLRQSRQAAKIRISVDGVLRLDELICDGILLSTPAGSTAYNLSAHGPIIPIGTPLLAMTPISAFRPRRWRGALLPHRARVRFDVLDAQKRPVSATADYTEVRDVASVEVYEDRDVSVPLLFDSEHNLEERILREQFLP
ncbi:MULTISPECIES: NAD kinase [Limibacillus]|uniref:NAD kinase n=1 Tax=Limibacillus halophilus TaxID=1579333 RepID=A0A839SQH5_9PROT|nr:NAD kinase [Limibacillus halophilus]MBB3065147.1 NAD+ kinase [Limibacillus halophilus]